MPVSVARSLLPPTSVIGVSCNTVEHVKMAVNDGVDYVGIGPVWTTQTKKLTSPILGVRGIGELLEALDGDTSAPPPKSMFLFLTFPTLLRSYLLAFFPACVCLLSFPFSPYEFDFPTAASVILTSSPTKNLSFPTHH